MRRLREPVGAALFALIVVGLIGCLVAWEIAVWNDCRDSGMGRLTCWRIVTAR